MANRQMIVVREQTRTLRVLIFVLRVSVFTVFLRLKTLRKKTTIFIVLSLKR